MRVDEHGYTEWIALRLPRPICALADPTDQFKGAVEGVAVLQTFNADNALVRSQLERLIGRRGVLTGELTQWGTGYQRGELVFDVASVQATDDAGHLALSLRANIAETLLVHLITEQGGKEIQHEEYEDILSGPVGRAQ